MILDKKESFLLIQHINKKCLCLLLLTSKCNFQKKIWQRWKSYSIEL